MLDSLFFAVEEEVSETRAEHCMQNGDEEGAFELEQVWMCGKKLEHAFHPLGEDGAELVVGDLPNTVSGMEPVAHGDPFFLNKDAETTNCTVEGIQSKHG